MFKEIRRVFSFLLVLCSGWGLPGSLLSECLSQTIDNKQYTLSDIFAAWRNRPVTIRSGHFRWKRTFRKEHQFSQAGEIHFGMDDELYECAFHQSQLFLKTPGVSDEAFYQAAFRVNEERLVDTKMRQPKLFLSEFVKSKYQSLQIKIPCIHHRLSTPQSATEIWFPLEVARSYPKVWQYEIPPQDQRTIEMLLWFQSFRGGNDSTLNLFSQAPLLALRPLDELHGGIRTSDCRLLPETRIVAGKECLVVQEALLGSPADTRTFWIDPAQNFAILRYQGNADFRLVVQLDFEYKEDKRYGSIPISWTVIHFVSATSTIRSFASTKDVQFDIGVSNRVIPEEFIYPPGSWLVDEVAGEQLLVNKHANKQIVGPFFASLEQETIIPDWDAKNRSLYSQWVQQQKKQAEIEDLQQGMLGVLLMIILFVLGWLIVKEPARCQRTLLLLKKRIKSLKNNLKLL